MIGLFYIFWGARQYAIGAIGGFLLFSAINALLWLPEAREEGRELERAASLKRSMELIEQRSRTNAEINALDDAGLCAALGGRWVPDKKLCE
ncbi:hypothetical protein C7U60_02735 [Mesorhizobium plurifarium]|uniref:hypothetical protein n=1 Tax=Sinorhizobium arboris TaxID=76745 RepID=UPI000481746A|nr:hypothetical protein [Sinorhizobium arboris]PST27217.1 hypothetical protein C7U60_02735 [Mesorhizobium plurifarium]